ncbi:MAG: hypothetical protein KF706_07665 [Chitinophagales bacterium]|nr:hypothetical protein [Chitinophagales bacterium]
MAKRNLMCKKGVTAIRFFLFCAMEHPNTKQENIVVKPSAMDAFNQAAKG